MAGGVLSPVKSWLFGEDEPYNPDKSNFQYGGTGEGEWQDKAKYAGQVSAPNVGNYYDKYGMGQAKDWGLQSRQSQSDAINQYKGLLSNPNGSIAQKQLQYGNQQNVASMMAAARSGNPNAGGSNMRTAMEQGMAAGAQTNGQAGMLRAQETQSAIAGLAQASAAQRAADLQAQGMSAQQAQYQASIEMQQQQMNNQMQMGLYGLGQNASMAQLNAGMGMESLKAGQKMASNAANAQMYGATMGLVGAGVTGGATLLAPNGNTQGAQSQPSDERSKEKIEVLQDRNETLQSRLQSFLQRGGPMGFIADQGTQIASEQPRTLEHLPTPASKSSVHDEASAADYGRRWLADQRAAAMQDQAQQLQQVHATEQAQARLAHEQMGAQQQGAIAGFMGAPPAQGAPVNQPIPSDERSKQRIQELEGVIADYQNRMTGSVPGHVGRMPDANEAVNALKPVAFDYKPEFQQYGQGRQVGILAGDLRKTPAGTEAVVPGPQGMDAVDPGKASTLALAASADQEHRIRELEDMYRSKIGEYDRIKGAR